MTPTVPTKRAITSLAIAALFDWLTSATVSDEEDAAFFRYLKDARSKRWSAPSNRRRSTPESTSAESSAPVVSPDDLCFRCEQRRGDHNHALCINFVERPVVSPSSEPPCIHRMSDGSLCKSREGVMLHRGHVVPPRFDNADYCHEFSPTDTNREKS